jgi:hypothetical protein
MMLTSDLLSLARSYSNNGATMASSALSCIADAERLLAAGKEDLARGWCVRSLKYSIGILHPDFVRAKAAVNDAHI